MLDLSTRTITGENQSACDGEREREGEGEGEGEGENRCGCCFAANVTRKKKNKRNETRISYEIIKGGKSSGKQQ